MPEEREKPIKLRHPVVIIFGAGASRGGLADRKIPPPVDKDFFDIANQLAHHGTPKLAKEVLKDVWELYGRTNGVGLEAYYRDLETRGIINEFAKSANQPKNWRKRERDLVELIRRVYVETTVDSTTREHLRSKIHEGILTELRKKDTIVTFNYDLMIEEALRNADIWNPVDGYGIKTSGKTKGWAKGWLNHKKGREKRSAIKLLKLHGSLNWQSKPWGIRLQPRPYLVSTRDGKTRFEKISILAPGWKKPIDKNPYRKFWRAARLQLEKCKTLIVLGYSLPETDLLAQSLLAEVARMRAKRKEYLKQLHLADPDKSVKERFVKLFTPALGPHGQIFKYEDIGKFEERRRQ